jgi:hypothetical protein
MRLAIRLTKHIDVFFIIDSSVFRSTVGCVATETQTFCATTYYLWLLETPIVEHDAFHAPCSL